MLRVLCRNSSKKRGIEKIFNKKLVKLSCRTTYQTLLYHGKFSKHIPSGCLCYKSVCKDKPPTNYCNESIVILSDSQAALKSISAYEVKLLLVQECIVRLNSLSDGNQLHFIWVPSYTLGYNLSRFKIVINLPRNKFRLLVSFYTGHCNLKKH